MLIRNETVVRAQMTAQSRLWQGIILTSYSGWWLSRLKKRCLWKHQVS